MSYGAHSISYVYSEYLSSDTQEEQQDQYILLDRRYRVSRAIEHASDEQRFHAYHVELAIPLCVTTLHPQRGRTAATRATYLKESSASSFWKLALQAASLRHPVLPRFHDSFLHGDTYYVVTDDPAHPHDMERDASTWQAGETLAQRLERSGRLSLREALIFGLHLCDALAYLEQVAPTLLPLTTIAPRHLILPQASAIVLADLRPARWLDAARCTCADADLPYCAPEVIAGGPQDVRADIYSIAAVLYHMLAGTPPTVPVAGHEWQTLDEIEPLVPAALSDVIELALQPDAEARFADANTFGRALADALTELLPALVARLNAPYASGPEHGVNHVGGEKARGTDILRRGDRGNRGNDRQRADDSMPATAHWGRKPSVRRPLPKRARRSALATLSSALGLHH